jgi:hypothetical protein
MQIKAACVERALMRRNVTAAAALMLGLLAGCSAVTGAASIATTATTTAVGVTSTVVKTTADVVTRPVR